MRPKTVKAIKMAEAIRDIPGGRDGRRMLLVNFVDKTGSGLWVGAAALYYTSVVGMDVRRVGLLLALAGAVGVAGSPVAGRIADRVSITRLLIAVQSLRAAAAVGILLTGSFWLLLPLAALASFGERSASVLTKLYAARVAGPDRVRYQAVNRTIINVGFALGGLAAAAALAIGSDAAFHTLLVGDALSYVIAALLVTRCAQPPSPSRVVAAGTRFPEQPVRRSSPWRDRGYLAYVGTEALLLLDDAILNVGLPLWIVTRTSAPHSLAAVLLVLNNILVVLFVLPLSRLGRTPQAAASSLRLVAAAFLAGCAAMAASAAPDSPWAATALLAGAAVAFTVVEMVHAAVSWELSLALAPACAQGAYLGVHGLAQSAERSAGPLILTSAVIVAGPAGWLALGAGLVLVAAGQRALVCRRLDGPGQRAQSGDPAPSGHIEAADALESGP